MLVGSETSEENAVCRLALPIILMHQNKSFEFSRKFWYEWNRAYSHFFDRKRGFFVDVCLRHRLYYRVWVFIGSHGTTKGLKKDRKPIRC